MKGVVAFAVVVFAASGCGGGADPEVGVDHATLMPGRIQLTLANPASVEQVIVNDAFVDFRAGGDAITLRYPWIEGESYDVELLTSTGATIEYEIEDAEAA